MLTCYYLVKLRQTVACLDLQYIWKTYIICVHSVNVSPVLTLLLNPFLVSTKSLTNALSSSQSPAGCQTIKCSLSLLSFSCHFSVARILVTHLHPFTTSTMDTSICSQIEKQSFSIMNWSQYRFLSAPPPVSRLRGKFPSSWNHLIHKSASHSCRGPGAKSYTVNSQQNFSNSLTSFFYYFLSLL